MKVLGMNKSRHLVMKDLNVSNEHGAILSYGGEDICIEPDIDIWNRIYQPDTNAEGYFCAFLHVTSKCNKHCKYCYARNVLLSHDGKNTIADLINTIKNFVPDDPRGFGDRPYKEYEYDGYHPVIRCIGGEPTVYPDLRYLLWYVVNNTNNKIYVYTNGLEMLSEKFLENMPDSRQICWALSIDHKMSLKFIERWTENIIKNGGKQEYAYNILLDEKYEKEMLERDAFIRTFKPQEIRYRGVSDQLNATFFPTVSSILKFIEKSRGIPAQTFIDKARFHQQLLTCLNHKDTENPETGNIVVAMLALWKTMIVQEISKCGSFVVNTGRLHNTAESHNSSIPLLNYRMKFPQRFYHPGLEPLWGKWNNIYKESK